jgi:glycopeptide antibiotics resistance protein
VESAAQPTGADTPPAPTRARLSRALLAYFVGVVLVITLAPFRFAVPRDVRVFYTGDAFDLATNVLLFVPLGFLYPLTRPHRRWTLVAQAAGLGLLLSAAVEAVQLFERDRYTSAVDLLANGLGALAGAALQHALSRRVRLGAAAVGRLSLELPLMGLVYLLVPLLWLGSLAAREQPLRVAPLLLLGLFGGTLLAGMQRHRFGPAGSLGVGGVALAAAGWMALGVFPALVFHPAVALPVLATVALATAWEASSPDASPDRRFEARTLRRAAPAFGAYLLAMVLAPLASGTAAWTGWLGFAGRAASLGTAEQLHLLESVAALTVLGYLLAEARSRRELPFGALAPRLAAECGVAAAAVEGVRGFQPAWGASLAQTGMLVGAGLLGGWIFHLQRDHVRALGAARPPAADPDPALPAAAPLAAARAP